MALQVVASLITGAPKCEVGRRHQGRKQMYTVWFLDHQVEIWWYIGLPSPNTNKFKRGPILCTRSYLCRTYFKQSQLAEMIESNQWREMREESNMLFLTLHFLCEAYLSKWIR